MNDFLGVAQIVFEAVALIDQIVQVAEDGAQVLAGCDGAPAPNRMEADRNGALGQERRGLSAQNRVWMVDAEDEEENAVGGGLAILAGATGSGKLKCANDVLGTEVA